MIRAKTLALEKETDGLREEILWGAYPVKATEAKLLQFLKRSPQFVAQSRNEGMTIVPDRCSRPAANSATVSA